MAILIDVQKRCSRLNTVPGLPRKSVAEVRAAREQRLHLRPDGGPETLFREQLRAGPGPHRVEAALGRLEPVDGLHQRLRRRILEEDAGLRAERLQRATPGEGD